MQCSSGAVVLPGVTVTVSPIIRFSSISSGTDLREHIIFYHSGFQTLIPGPNAFGDATIKIRHSQLFTSRPLF